MKLPLYHASIFLPLAIQASPLQLPPNFVFAIASIESSGNPFAVGDSGKSIGIFQISRAAFKDAREFDKKLAIYNWQDCFSPSVSTNVLTAYLNRYARSAILKRDFQTLARIWNGGPKGATKEATLIYWNRVKKRMETYD